ncbi:hypothetical protein L6452_28893 [Arctium lappa]|uniref:Uncharacterized protein n=1 Tax=Arctium lappa TaxID=4217 RepID=A0ACB8ZZY2_ARCLA|nr:hypothetical protein L6452_28893 [Arctium lappa]
MIDLTVIGFVGGATYNIRIKFEKFVSSSAYSDYRHSALWRVYELRERDMIKYYNGCLFRQFRRILLHRQLILIPLRTGSGGDSTYKWIMFQ